MTLKLILLSAGSLLGQNILEMLEPRRASVEVFGLNTISTPHFMRCDRSQIVPPTQSSAFLDSFKKLLSEYQPTWILPGRDDDVVFLSAFAEAHPEYRSAILTGPSHLAQTARSKALTRAWAEARHLPFAQSWSWAEAQNQLSDLPYPLIAKPVEGFGSRNVYIIPDAEALTPFQEPHWIFQEYLSPPAALPQLIEEYRKGVPLFFQIPEHTQYAGQGVIGPGGKILGTFTGVSHMVHGRCVFLAPFKHEAFAQLLDQYLRALTQEGWRGSVNVQAKPDSKGVWKTTELNLRMSGGSSARVPLGFDELGLLCQAYFPAHEIPLVPGQGKGRVERVYRDVFVPE